MAHQKFQNVDLQKFQYNEEVTAVHLGAIIKSYSDLYNNSHQYILSKMHFCTKRISISCYLHTLC